MPVQIPTHTSLAGRLAGDPRLRRSTTGTAYVRVRVDVFPPRQRLADGGEVMPPPVGVDLVAFEDAANVLHNRFRFGDWLVAAGRLKPSPAGTPSFITRRIGHDATRADYKVTRTGKRVRRRPAPTSATTAPKPAERPPIVAGRILPDPRTTARTA